MSKHLGETIPLKAVVFNESGVPVTTATIKVQVIRDSDGNYWTGSAWSAVKTDLAVAHVGSGLYVYSLDTSHASFLSPPSITCFFWSSDTELEDSYGINFTLDEDYEARVVADSILAEVVGLQAKLPTNNIMGSSVKTDKDDEIDDIQSKVAEIYELTVAASGAVVADGGNTALTFKTNQSTLWADDYFNNLQIIFSNDGTPANTGQARRITDYDDTTGFITVDVAFDSVPVDTDVFYILSRWTGFNLSELTDAIWSEVLPGSYTGSEAGKVVADIFDDTGTSLPADIANNLTAIQAIQNNTRFTAAVPNPMQKPDAGDKSYRHAANLYDTQGDMEDPDNSEILVRIIKNDGTFITANLYKENALSNGLDDPTDTGIFPPASGWRAMEREAVGKYFFFYKVASTETEEPLTVEFGWDEGGQVNYQSRATKISDVTDDIEDILLEVTAIGVKVDSGTPSPTIPAQITTHDTDIKADIATHDTDIKALQRVDACPDLFYVPDGRTQIDLDGGITDVQVTIPVALSDNLLSAGIVKIESEYVIYTGVSGGSLTGCTRGAYSTSNVAHADDTPVSQTLMFPIMLVIRDNEGNMLAPDSAPTIEIEDWNEVQELAPTAMTLKSTGVYRYNYLIDYGTLAENKLLKFVTVIDSITAQHRHMVVIIDEPASSLDLVRYLGGGTGDFILDQDGWYDSDGIKTLWTDVAKGYIRDADTGAPLDDAYVTAYPIINGETKYSGRPTAQAITRSNGTYLMALDYNSEGYTFVIEKDGFRIVGDGVVERTVGP